MDHPLRSVLFCLGCINVTQDDDCISGQPYHWTVKTVGIKPNEAENLL